MGRMIYRLCLIVVLVLAVAGGVYYYTTFYQKEEGPRKGTFVHKMDDREPDAESAKQTGKRIYEAAESISGQAKDAGREAKEAFVYGGETIKNASAKAGKAVKEVSTQAGTVVSGHRH